MSVHSLSPAPISETRRDSRGEPTSGYIPTAAGTIKPLGPIRRADRTGLPLLAIRVVLGLMFVYMGLNKLVDPVVFLKAIHQYRMLPESPGIYLNLAAVVLPWLEIFAGMALLLGMHIRGAALALIIMLGVFTPAVYLRALEVQRETPQSFFDIKFDCGCGSGPEVIWRKLLMNIGLFLLALGALLSKSRKCCLSILFERRSAPVRYCHFCEYAVKRTQAGLCSTCATPPVIE
jgi:uncharacterized membrane protein YphA (DoxX/SURF4 family)